MNRFSPSHLLFWTGLYEVDHIARALSHFILPQKHLEHRADIFFHTDRTMGHRPVHGNNVPRPIITYPSWPQNLTEASAPSQPYYPSLISPALSETILPDYIKAVPQRIGSDETSFLLRKGALSLPPVDLRNALLQSYVEHVDPFMPTLDMNEFLEIVDARDGSRGQISLLLFQAVMFTASAFVDMHYLRRAGYGTRKDARKSFYTRTRVRKDHRLYKDLD